MVLNLPDPWAWDDYDMYVVGDEAAAAARRVEIIVKQVESFDAEVLPWTEEVDAH